MRRGRGGMRCFLLLLRLDLEFSLFCLSVIKENSVLPVLYSHMIYSSPTG